jgi:hypothetical protein
MRRSGIGLIGQGSLALSYLARLPSLLGRVALVKGSNERTSSRLRNSLRAGRWVNEYREFAPCRVLWIAVSEDSLPQVLEELAGAVNLSHRLIILGDTLRDARSFKVLSRCGAYAATVMMMPQSAERIFIAEGHKSAMKELAEILEADNRKVIELKPGAKPLFVSGVHLSAHLVLPFAGAAVESFRAAGLTRGQATLAMQAITGNALRSYARGGDKALPRPHAEEMRKVLAEEREAMRAISVRLAELYDAQPEKWFSFVGSKRFWRESAEKDRGRTVKHARAGNGAAS